MMLKTKMRLSLAVLLIIAILLPLIFMVQHIRSESNLELMQFEAEETDKLRDTAKNFVDLGYEMINLDYQLLTNRRHIARVYGELLREQVNMTMQFLQQKVEKVTSGQLSLQQAQNEAIAMISALRLNGRQDYIWVQNTEKPFAKMIVHPLVPELNGKILDNESFNCARGKGDNLFAAAVETALEDPEGGFIDYLWPKILADGSRIPGVAKVSYVRLFPEWNWILGTGIYIDDAINNGISRIKEDIARIRYDGGNSYFWLHDASGNLLCHGNPEWIELSQKKKKPGETVLRGIELVKKQQSGEFFEFKGSLEEFAASDERVAYIRLFKPLNWVIGTSISKAEMKQRIANKAADVRNRVSRISLYGMIFFVVFSSFSLFIIGRILGPFAMIDLDKNDSSGKLRLIEKEPEALKTGEMQIRQDVHSSIAPEILQTISEITRHSISEQSRLLSLQLELMAKNNDRLTNAGDKAVDKARADALTELQNSLVELARSKTGDPKELRQRLSELEDRFARLVKK